MTNDEHHSNPPSLAPYQSAPEGAVSARPAIRTGAQDLWVRQLGLRPSAGVNLDPAVLRPFSLAALGLTRLDRRHTQALPLPVVSRLAIDMTGPHALAITYLEHPDDAETPLVHTQFADEHPADWITALTRQQHLLLTVSAYGPPLNSATAATAARALGDAWAGIIACSPDCAHRSDVSRPPVCVRHRLTDRRQRLAGNHTVDS